jgi:hypothetical protein
MGFLGELGPHLDPPCVGALIPHKALSLELYTTHKKLIMGGWVNSMMAKGQKRIWGIWQRRSESLIPKCTSLEMSKIK